MFKEVEEEYSDLPICISQGVSGQAVFVGLQEGLGPFSRRMQLCPLAYRPHIWTSGL